MNLKLILVLDAALWIMIGCGVLALHSRHHPVDSDQTQILVAQHTLTERRA
ncbi:MULTISPECIES: hypothetical protein [Novosphingobium]|uniref:hypothetical protein n=1 Tax=Novosphingobium sp. ST904 TaxID=1684385 RepID=UPI0014045B1A|nr:hypothetical protein [Novosphingobium sp. ST904]